MKICVQNSNVTYSIYFFSEKNSKFTSTYDISDQGNYLKNHDNVTGIGLTMNEDWNSDNILKKKKQLVLIATVLSALYVLFGYKNKMCFWI